MATYVPVPRSVPEHLRMALITDVVVGDRINIYDVLGKVAQHARFIMPYGTDTVTYALNTIRQIRTDVDPYKDLSEYDQHHASYETHLDIVWVPPEVEFTNTGVVSSVVQNLPLESIEIISSSVGGSGSISILVW